MPTKTKPASAAQPTQSTQSAKIHEADSAGYIARDGAWLAEHVPGLPGVEFRDVWHYPASVRIAGDLICEGTMTGTCVVVDGDLEVDGDVYFCSNALIVRGAIRCAVFESWASHFVIAKAIRAKRSIAFTSPLGTDHEVGRFEAPLCFCFAREFDDHFSAATRRGIRHVIDSTTVPDGIGDAMVMELLRTRTDEVVARLEARKPIWTLIPPEPPARLVKIVDAVRAGATMEWTELSGKPAVRVVAADGTRQMSVLTDAERTQLDALLAK